MIFGLYNYLKRGSQSGDAETKNIEELLGPKALKPGN